jgi:hypothetical protein
MQLHATAAIYVIAALSAAGVVLRPFNLAEAVWAVVGAGLLVALGLISVPEALAGAAKGTDVYLFLFGMMLLAEIAREEGLFDWLAAVATSHARGSARRLFLLTYVVGTVVTIFLSNDATAVVLTPAVAAAVRAAKAKEPLPYLLICAFIANAASFVLPISNPANLVIYGSRMPPLWQWLPAYLLPSLVSIVATYLLLRFTQRHALRQEVGSDIARPALSVAGKIAAVGIVATAVVLLTSSALGIPLGLPTVVAGVITAIIVVIGERVVRAGRGARQDRADRYDRNAAARRRATFGPVDRCRRRRLRRLRQQSHQQSAGRLDRRQRGAGWPDIRSGHARHRDRRRSRTQPLGDRLARDHPVACGAAPRRPFGRPWRLPENRSRGDATGADPGAGGGIAAEMSTNHRANGWRIRGMALMVDDVAPLEAIRVL